MFMIPNDGCHFKVMKSPRIVEDAKPIPVIVVDEAKSVNVVSEVVPMVIVDQAVTVCLFLLMP